MKLDLLYEIDVPKPWVRVLIRTASGYTSSAPLKRRPHTDLPGTSAVQIRAGPGG